MELKKATPPTDPIRPDTWQRGLLSAIVSKSQVQRSKQTHIHKPEFCLGKNLKVLCALNKSLKNITQDHSTVFSSLNHFLISKSKWENTQQKV